MMPNYKSMLPFRMNKLLLILLFASVCAVTKAQTEEVLVKAAVNKLFIAMKTGDAGMLTSCFTDGALLQSIAADKEGNAIINNEPIVDFAKQISRLPKGAADERIIFRSVQIDGTLANVWTPYTFYFNDKFSHCGVNNFILVKLKNEWKIQYIIDTRRKNGCVL